jgi:hypothetical protein
MPVANRWAMIGSDIALDPRIVEGSGAMPQADMEARLEMLDLRLSRIEQILPTLATKDDLAQVESRQRSLTESVIDRVNNLADAYTVLTRKVETETGGIRYTLDRLVERLEAKDVI